MLGIFIFVTKTWLSLSNCCPSNSDDLGTLGCACHSSYKCYTDSKLCLPFCPTRFYGYSDEHSSWWCNAQTDTTLFTLSFSASQDLTETYIASSTGFADQFTNPGSISYNHASHNSPLPTLDRGFYFATTSGITSNVNYIPALYFTLNMWIMPLSSGEILNVLASSTQYIRIYADSSTVYKFSGNIFDNNGNGKFVAGTATSTYTNLWHSVSVTYEQIDCGTLNVSFYINGIGVGATMIMNAEARFAITTYTWKIGSLNGGDSFRGFIYWLQARSDTTRAYGAMTSTINCVNNQYWDGSNCQNCDVNCPTWPWCIKGTSCSICYSIDCNTCYGYSVSMCTACTTGIVPACCDIYGTICTQTWSNTACDISTGKILAGYVCLYACPYEIGACASISTAVITADFTGAFTGSYDTVLIAGTSSASHNYWTSPENSDPFPAKNRGLYFNSNQFLEGQINLANTWSICMWVYAISGTLISHSTNKLTIDSSGLITFYLEKWDATLGSWSASQSIPSRLWSYVSYTSKFSNKVTTVTPYLNNIAGTHISITDYVFRLPGGGSLYIGKGSPNFNGFIAHFMLWQIAKGNFAAYLNINTLTGGIVSTLWPCDYSQYYDGSNCQACISTCTMGCTRGTSCYICDDFLCTQCTSFQSGACSLCVSNASGTPCTCESGYYQPTNQALCSVCYTGCTHCTDSTYYSCTSCGASLFLYNSMVCLLSCPTGYTENSGTSNCDFTSTTGLSLYLYDKIMLNSVSGVTVGNSMSNTYPSYDTNDPYPTYLRGYYFTGTTYMSTNTVIGPYFTVSAWINPNGSGTVLSKTVSGAEIFCLEILSGSGNPKLSLILKDTSPLTVTLSENALNTGWNFIAFTGKIDANHKTTISSYFNSLTKETGTSSSLIYFQDRSANTIYIGTKASFSSGFSGFLYDLYIFNIDTMQYNDYATSSCSSSCSSCPSDHNCPSTCPFGYYEGAGYISCNSCPKGCRYTDTCGLCKTRECYECTSFSGSCSSCITNAEFDGSGGCQCKANTFWRSSTSSCDFCDALCAVCKQTTYFECNTCIGGKQIRGIICLNDCPYGYGASCTSISTPVIDQSFDVDFQGSYGIFTTGTDSTKYQHFVSPETIDPIPAYARGLYFDGNMYLLSSVSVYLSHSFTIGAWIYIITDGDLLQKQSKLVLTSTGSITAIMEDITQVTTIQTLSPISSFTGWGYLSISIFYIYNNSGISLYINGISAGFITISGKIFRDQASTNLLLGKSTSPGFVGFIYYFQLWNIQITYFSTIINGFTFCGSGQGAICLWECNISTYKDSSSCSACNSCSKGCVRASTCNICDDLLCTICSGFGSGKCSQCVSNASGAPNPCVCNAGYGTSNDGFSCQPCSAGCSKCNGLTYQKCLECFSGKYFFASTGQCLDECPSGYTANSVGNKCDFSSFVGISLDLTDQVRLDTVSSFNVGAVNNNNYPDWSLDSFDPIPSYKRGYYFYQNNYLSASVVISPSFTITMWIKPLSDGILMTKYTTTDIIKITVDSSGYPLISIVFSDSSLVTLTTPTSLINNWNFLSFTGQVQSDGKTLLTLYINTVTANSFTTTSLIYFKDTNSGTLYIGNDETFGALGLRGFLARLNIYNTETKQSDDYTTSPCNTGCSACPSNNQCLSNCAVNEYPDTCTTCLTGCSQGCVSDFTCRLCRDKECYSCTTFSGECTSCITHASKQAGHCACDSNAVWVSSSQSCELCNTICATCSSVDYAGCLTCKASYYLIQSLCMTFCPTGYLKNGGNCDPDSAYTDFLVFNLVPHQIKDVVTDLASNITVLTGINNKFYPTYDTTDPIATIYRGYYFTGSSYMQLPPYTGTASPLLTFAPKFVISAWIKPISNTGVIFCKQSDSGGYEKYVSFELFSKLPELYMTLQDSTSIVYTNPTASLETTLSQWNFISALSDASGTPEQIIKLTVNTYTDISSDLYPRWLNDLESSFFIWIGKSYLDPTSFFNGFIWDLKIYNDLTTNSLVSSTCSGCSLCPIDNSNMCLDNCLIDKYWNGNACDTCQPECSTFGCVRRDKNCNLCQDIICEVCDDYTSTCISCRTHATLIGSNCECDSRYYWNASNEDCELCDISCKTCTSSNFLDCLTCADGYYFASGICGTSCPLGYVKSVSGCKRVNEKMFELDLNTLNGIIYDKASSIPVVTGSTKKFYPDYEADDPIPAYLRGFWFNGESSVLRLPEYSNYTSPRLVIAPVFTISIWLNIENSYSAILSKHNISNGYSELYSITLMDNTPIFSSSLGKLTIYYVCDASLKHYEWSHVVFTLDTTPSGYNSITCSVNGISYPSVLTGYGAFSDAGPLTTMAIGAQIGSTNIYNFYKGFIYLIEMFNIAKPVSSLSTVSCTENCSVCPLSQICMPNCNITEYWSGPAYNLCYQCHTKCNKTCRDWKPTCSLCSNLLCDICTDYSSSGCETCKEHAINNDYCICDENYVLNTTNSNTCIPLEAGGFRGPDGKFYSCPNYCTYCESLTKCIACVQNASLKNDLCYCLLGYNGTNTCALIPFSAWLTVLYDNSLYLTFSDSLANILKINDFTILIENQGKISYKMEQINITCYYITLSISKEVSKGTPAILKFLDLSKVRSISNGILNSSEIWTVLNAYDPDPYSTAVAAIAAKTTAGVQAAVSVAVALSLVNPSPSSLWSMINTLEILSYLTLSGIPFTNKMRTFLNNLNSFNIFPNIFEYIIDKNEGNKPYSQAVDFGYDSDLILLTTGNDFTLILASFSALPFIFFFSRCSYRWIGKKFMKSMKAYQFSFYLRFWIQSYLELGAAASVALVTFGLSTQLTNMIICSAISLLLVVTPPAYFLLSYKNKARIQSREKTFAALFSSLFYEFRTDNGLLATQYYFVFFLRRLIYIISLVYLKDYPQTEVTINIVLSVMTIMHLMFYWPFEDPILQYCNFMAEISILLIMSTTSVYLFNLDQKIISLFESAIVVIVIIAMGIQLFASVAIFSRTLYEVIRNKLTKEGIVKTKKII